MTATRSGNGATSPVILRPIDIARAYPFLGNFETPGVWVYRYTDANTGWRLSIATCAEPGSGNLSLGGFRIAPDERTSSPGFDTDHEAVSLAVGMEEKVYWSRLVSVGGPLALRDTSRMVGGKCVLHPSADARIGGPHDSELLDFAIACFKDVEERAGFFLVTGQDLGHGVMSDGTTTSLDYLNERFKGSVVADTSKPTGEGNYQVLAGMLRGMGIAVERATVGLIGCGNVGMHVLGRLRKQGTAMLAVESSADRREQLALLGIPTFAPDEKSEFLRRPMDAMVINAAGGSLDAETIARVADNDRLRVLCGSENLVMPDAAGGDVLRRAKKAYAPTELGGMMGYLSAVEEYLARVSGVPFEPATVFDAARKLEGVCYEATRRLRGQSFTVSFQDAVRQVCDTTS